MRRRHDDLSPLRERRSPPRKLITRVWQVLYESQRNNRVEALSFRERRQEAMLWMRSTRDFDATHVSVEPDVPVRFYERSEDPAPTPYIEHLSVQPLLRCLRPSFP
jgi:hypothetical protein